MKDPRVGVGVWIQKDGKVLLGRRMGSFEPDTWCIPGGAVDSFETAEEAAARETAEETGLKVKTLRFIKFQDDISKDRDSHWVTLYFAAECEPGKPRDHEGEIGEWGWFDWGDLPTPLFSPTRNFVENGYNPFK